MTTGKVLEAEILMKTVRSFPPHPRKFTGKTNEEAIRSMKTIEIFPLPRPRMNWRLYGW